MDRSHVGEENLLLLLREVISIIWTSLFYPACPQIQTEREGEGESSRANTRSLHMDERREMQKSKQGLLVISRDVRSFSLGVEK